MLRYHSQQCINHIEFLKELQTVPTILKLRSEGCLAQFLMFISVEKILRSLLMKGAHYCFQARKAGGFLFGFFFPMSAYLCN